MCFAAIGNALRMSTAIMGMCWPLRMPPLAKAVLVSLADQANDEGLCWPSIRSIVQRTCLSERSVQHWISWLEHHGAMYRSFRSGHSTHYIVTPAAYAPPQDVHPAARAPHPRTTRTPAPAGGAPPGVQDVHPEPSVEPSVEPSENHLTSRKQTSKPPKSETEAYKTKKGRTLCGQRLRQFEEFFSAFGYRAGKAAAADSWLAIKNLDELLPAILAAARHEAGRRPQIVASGCTPKMAQGWLTDRRWEDQAAPAEQPAAQNLAAKFGHLLAAEPLR